MRITNNMIVQNTKGNINGNKVYVDVEISVERDSSLLEAHDTAERVHDALEHQFPSVKHVMIHVNPGAETTTSTGSPS